MLSRPITPEEAEAIGAFLMTIGQPVRIRVIEALDRLGELSVQQLAAEVDISESDASRHLTRLWRDRLVRRRQQGRFAIYRLADDHAAVAVYTAVVASWPRAPAEPEVVVRRAS